MNRLIKISLLLSTLLLAAQVVSAQKEKKVKSFTTSYVIQAPADQVWAVVGEDYGAIANSHPKIIRSEYISGSLQSGEGAERICYFNESGTQYLKEKQVNYDPENYTFRNQVFQAGKFPVDPAYTFAIYKVEVIDENTSRFVFNMNFRTKPAIMAGLMKGSFKKLIADYAIAIEHHVTTRENVNKENFKEIKKLHRPI